MKLVAVSAILLLLASASHVLSEEPAAASKGPAAPATPAEKLPDQAQLDKWFAETMSGATLVGHFTVDGRGSGEPKEERYTIQKVTKQQGDYWLFLARIQFGGRDVTIPMRIPVKWAGDTAVISVTDLGFPGLGTYTARVLIYGDQYAGTWSGKDHGGHLWGRIERADKDGQGADSSTGPGEKKSDKSN
jgi:hypothetical protein